MDPSSTSTITEFAIAVAGFTGVVFALDRSDGPTDPLIRLRTITMLFYAFSAAFGSLIPTLLQSYGSQVDIWVQSNVALALILVANMVATVISSRVLLEPEQRQQLRGWMWLLVMGGNSLFTVCLVGSLTGVIPIPTAAAFFTALVWQLVLSTILFIRVLMMLR